MSVGISQAHDSAHLHVSGEALYCDDIPLPANALHAAFGVSTIAHGLVKSLDLSAVLAAPGVVAVGLPPDIPGENNYGGVVHDHQWLNERQFVDAVAVAMITPGPVVITVGFIGYLIAGLSGAVVAALGTFLPCYLFTIVPAPYFKKYGKRPALLAFVAGVTAAAIGAITGAVIVLAERSIVDVLTALMTLVTIALLWKLKKAPEPVLVAIAALVGLVAFPRLHP